VEKRRKPGRVSAPVFLTIKKEVKSKMDEGPCCWTPEGTSADCDECGVVDRCEFVERKTKVNRAPFCPICGRLAELAEYDPYFRGYFCTRCNWRSGRIRQNNSIIEMLRKRRREGRR